MGVWTTQQLVFGFFLELGGDWERGVDYAGDILLLTDNSFFFFTVMLILSVQVIDLGITWMLLASIVLTFSYALIMSESSRAVGCK
jgi:hypothetical protein